MALGKRELADRFGTKSPIPGGTKELRHLQVRERFFDFACFLDEVLPDGRHKGLVMNELQTASMYAQKAVAETSEDIPPLGDFE